MTNFLCKLGTLFASM